MTIGASVVVPTYHRPDLIQRCLSALVAQDLSPECYEIIIVDNGGCDETRRRVLDLADRTEPAVRYIRVEDTKGPAAARNAGWRASSGSIVAFTDDDCVPNVEWLRSGLAAFVDSVAGVSGRIMVPIGPAPTDYERNAAHLAQSSFVTANCFYRREALETMGGFDERFEMAWREDTDLYFGLLERGARLVAAPEAVVVHPVRQTSWGVSLTQQRKSGFNALLYLKHRRLYRERIQASPPWQYYTIVAALAAIPAALAMRCPRLAALAAIAWAVLTARFCRRRLQGTSHAPRHIVEMVVTSAVIPPLSIFWRIRGAIRFRVLFL